MLALGGLTAGTVEFHSVVLPALFLLVGPGPGIAAASTVAAAYEIRHGQAVCVCVSGDQRAISVRLLALLGVDPSRQGLYLQPLSAEHQLNSRLLRLALCEMAAMVLYRLQERM
jgi:hypothetical protein